MSTQLRKAWLWIIAVVSAVAVTGCLPLQQMGSTSGASLNSVCIKDDLSVVGFSGGFSLFGNISIDGDILLFGDAMMGMFGNASVQGKVFLDGNSSFSFSGNSKVSEGVEKADRSRDKHLLMSFASSIVTLPSTQELDSINRSQVIQGNGGINVIHVSKDIDLSGNDQVVLKGTEKDVFIFNVDGDVRVRGNASISVQGDVSAKKVVFNTVGTGSNVILDGNSSITGTFVAMNRGFSLRGNCKIHGTIVAGLWIELLGNGVTFSPGAFCLMGEDGDDGKYQPNPSASASPAPTVSPNPTVSPVPASSPLPCGGVVCSGGSLGV